MKKNFYIIFLLLSYSSLRAAPEELVDRILAEVNDEIILYSEIREKLARGQEVIVTEYPAKNDAPAKEKALQDQINFELIMQKAQEVEISVDDSELDQAIQKFLSSRGLDEAGLRESLRREGIAYEKYREDFRDQMILRQFQGRIILPLVKITDKDVENFYLSRMGKASEGMTLKLKQIVIASGSEAEKRRKADEALARLKAGIAFDQVVENFSEDEGSKKNQGLLPPVRLGDLSSELRSKVEVLSSSDYTQPIQVGSNFYIFLLVERSLTGSSDFKAQKQQLEMELRNQEIATQTIKWISDQRKKSKLRIISS